MKFKISILLFALFLTGCSQNLGGGITETSSLTAEVDKIKQLQADYAKDNSGKYFNTEKASISEKEEIAEFKSRLDEYQAPCGNGYTITLEKQEKDGLYQKVINEGCEKYREQDWAIIKKDL
jgi:hypothetical protein